MTGAEFFKELCERAQDGAATIEEVRDGVLEDVVYNKVVPRLMRLAKQQEREAFPATINFIDDGRRGNPLPLGGGRSAAHPSISFHRKVNFVFE